MLDPLAAESDLEDRGIPVPDGVNVDAFLASASEEVRSAAGCPILSVTSTVTLVAADLAVLDLPGGPVTAVASVVYNAATVVGWSKLGDSLLLPAGWARCAPVEVTVTYTHGYAEVPADIVDLVCGMVGIALAQSGGGYGSTGRLTSMRLGDFSQGFSTPPGTESPSPIALPERTKQALRARFGGSAVLLGARR